MYRGGGHAAGGGGVKYGGNERGGIHGLRSWYKAGQNNSLLDELGRQLKGRKELH